MLTVQSATCRYTGKPVWRVAYDYDGRPHITQWTTYRAEAQAWAEIIARHGYCASAGCAPAPHAYA